MAGQKKRATRTSKGVHGGGGKVQLTELQKVLMGKGVYQRLTPIGAAKPK